MYLRLRHTDLGVKEKHRDVGLWHVRLADPEEVPGGLVLTT